MDYICVTVNGCYIDPLLTIFTLKLKMMHHKQLVQLSKFLSYVLRHKPDAIGLVLEEGGWADVDELIQNAKRFGKPLTIQILHKIVADDDKQRYSFNADATKIRANQGHSLDVNLNLQAVTPPEFLYHGTAERNIASIRNKGLIKQQRHHVHLSQDQQTAKQVGGRYGRPAVLTVCAHHMASSGFVFYKSDNNVWLTNHVPAEFIVFPNSTSPIVNKQQQHILLLTGVPGIGKTTLIRKVAAQIRQYRIGGFYTVEIRQAGQRMGFRLVTFDGDEGIIAHVNFDHRYRVGKYGVDVAAMDRFADAALSIKEDVDIYLIDEIGKMECLAPRFIAKMEALLHSDMMLIATVGKKGGGLIEKVKHWPGSRLLEITHANRDALLTQVIAWLDGQIEQQ